MNTQTTISIDSDTLELWRSSRNGSLSAFVGQSILQKINQDTNTVAVVDIPILECAACKSKISVLAYREGAKKCFNCGNELFRVV